jgi:hypothetical protein
MGRINVSMRNKILNLYSKSKYKNNLIKFINLKNSKITNLANFFIKQKIHINDLFFLFEKQTKIKKIIL